MAAITVTTTPQQAPEDWDLLQNLSAVRIYIGNDNTVSSSNGVAMEPGGVYTRNDASAWRDPWVVVASGTADMRVMRWPGKLG